MLLSQWVVLGCAGLCFAPIGNPYIWFALKSSGGHCRSLLDFIGQHKEINALKLWHAPVKLLAVYAKPWSVYTGIYFKTQACRGPTKAWNSLKDDLELYKAHQLEGSPIRAKHSPAHPRTAHWDNSIGHGGSYMAVIGYKGLRVD